MTNTVTRTAPARIWLQVSDEAGDLGEPFPAALDSAVTWCQDSVMGCEVEYVRADVASGYQAQEPVAWLSHCPSSREHDVRSEGATVAAGWTAPFPVYAEPVSPTTPLVADAQPVRNISASDRLHSLCDAIAEAHDGSEWSREEWQRLDAEGTAQKARIAELEAQVEAQRKNAERYLKVRRGQHWSVIDGAGETLRGETLDAAVDEKPAVGAA